MGHAGNKSVGGTMGYDARVVFPSPANDPYKASARQGRAY